MGNLTLLGGLRGTKLELKRALGAPKEAPRGPKNWMIGMALLGYLGASLVATRAPLRANLVPLSPPSSVLDPKPPVLQSFQSCCTVFQ